MYMVEIIEKKRDGGELSTNQIEWFIRAYSDDKVPDYQAAALLMAIFLQGMNRRESVDLTLAMANSGDRLDLHDVVPFVVDKHSSGGVGDKTTLVIQPVVAACGVAVGKMSGRGLGLSGGTLDKMESFPGWSSDLTLDQFKKQLGEIGLVLSGQTTKLAPADGKLYALRDVTGTVANISLIASSIMSKKLAAGADAVVLDVKVGHGAFMPTLDEARELARLMVDIGKDAARQTVALISDMNQPLGHAVGNSLEVKEAIATLQGQGPPDFTAHCLEVSGLLLVLAGKADTLDEAKQQAIKVINNGRGLAKFRAMVERQGGQGDLVDNPDKLPTASLIEPIFSERNGFVAGIDAGVIGLSCIPLGGGREIKNEAIDHSVGMVIPVKVGDRIETGDLLGTVHANHPQKLDQASLELIASFSWSDQPVPALPLFHDTVR